MAKTDEEMNKCLREVSRIKKKLPSMSKTRMVSRKMKLLAHPTRLKILKLLSEKNLCVCVLSEVIGKNQPNISQHLTKLRENRVIEEYRVGKLVFYRLKDTRMRKLIRDLV